jgi:hypothetical protein
MASPQSTAAPHCGKVTWRGCGDLFERLRSPRLRHHCGTTLKYGVSGYLSGVSAAIAAAPLRQHRVHRDRHVRVVSPQPTAAAPLPLVTEERRSGADIGVSAVQDCGTIAVRHATSRPVLLARPPRQLEAAAPLRPVVGSCTPAFGQGSSAATGCGTIAVAA